MVCGFCSISDSDHWVISFLELTSSCRDLSDRNEPRISLNLETENSDGAIFVVISTACDKGTTKL